MTKARKTSFAAISFAAMTAIVSSTMPAAAEFRPYQSPCCKTRHVHHHHGDGGGNEAALAIGALSAAATAANAAAVLREDDWGDWDD